jgi:signal transduction histidine kinase
VWGIALKSMSKFSLWFKWIGLSAFITFICVVAGAFISRELLEQERKFEMRMGPIEHHYSVMKNLMKSGKFTVPEAFALVEKSDHHNPYKSYLVNSKSGIVDSSPEGMQKLPSSEKIKSIKINDEYTLVFEPDKKRPHGPPPGSHLIGLVAVGVSIVVGLALSFLFLTLFVRKKSRQAEEVLSRLKSGDLKARFRITEVDESTLLMQKFNDMAEQIENLVSNLRHTEKSRMIMLQELAHDLRTPVASLKQFQEILLYKGHLLDEEKKKQTQMLAMKEIHYFEKLVEDLLFLSGVNDPRYSASFSTVDVSEILEEEMETFDLNGITIAGDIPEHCIVKGDGHLLKRLFRNTISNAGKHARSSIQISVKNLNGETNILVSDDGKGMSEEDIKVFGEKKFSREVASDISIGLGSVIMKKIISLHDGTLEVKNKREGGLEVLIKIKNAS